MFKTFLSFLFASFLAVPLNAQPKLNFQKIWYSITEFSTDEDSCTMFAVRIQQYVTADHCIEAMNGKDMRSKAGTPIRVIKRDKDHDIALLEAEEIRPILELGEEPSVGDTVYQLGNGGASKRYVERYGFYHYIIPSLVINLHDQPFDDDESHMVFYGNAISGMSGGPIINETGKLVSIVQSGGSRMSAGYMIGAGVEYNVLKKFLKN